ncbi:MAG: aldehyde ferredoxin oxidoreductase C-terminal domain-containing protein [Candidatus Methanomethylicaceae archaeon]
MFGWKGRILRVDLTKNSVSAEELPEEWKQLFLGCRGINDVILWKEAPPLCGPFEDKNPLIFGTGPLEGTPVGMGRISIQTKHPQRLIGEGGAGGQWGPELKFAGYDFIVVSGRAPSPVYLYISDHKAELRQADHLWGKTVKEKINLLESEIRLPVQIACIGPGGERLIADAKVIFTGDHAGGRGCGTIMGFKNLAAIVVHGTGSVFVKDPQRFEKAYRTFRKLLDLRTSTDPYVPSWSFMSANMLPTIFNENGWLHAYNAQKGSIESFIRGEEYIANYVDGPHACFCCPFPACGRHFTVRGGQYGGASGNEREGGFGLVGAVAGITSWPVLLKFRELCTEAGVDEFMIAYTIGWAMECYEKGILTKNETDGLDLRFGNEEAFIRLVEKIIAREGIGDLLARGSQEASKILGRGSDYFLLTIKGRELEVMPQRGGYQMALALAVCEAGPDHTRWYPPYPPNPASIPGDLELPFDPALAFQMRNPQDKGRLVKWLYDSRAILESLPTCVFVIRGTLGIDMRPWYDLFISATGADCSFSDFLRIGERIVNLERCFIVREGFRRSHDSLPRRMLEDPIPDRQIPPIGNYFQPMLDEYYNCRGWTNNGIPRQETLSRLGLEFAISEIQRSENPC